jgi:integrase
MKASIKFQVSEKQNANGFPVYKVLRASGKTALKKTMFRCLPQHWNYKTNLITTEHPNYDLLIADLLNVKSAMASVNLGLYSYEDAKEKLFGAQKKQSTQFYKAAWVLVDDTSNGSLYGTVLNSFNTACPGVGISEITKSHAENYLKAILNHQTANGAHTYMRTLQSLFTKISDLENPFRGVRPKLVDTPSKDLSTEDLRRIFTTRTFKHKFDGRNTNETINYYRYYYMLMFYLGGIDAVDLAQLRYDKHVINGRVQFTRAKGGTSVMVNNKICTEALELLKHFSCYPYLVPLYKYKRHKDFVSNMNERLTATLKDLHLSRKPLSKSARYSFINMAQDLLIDERITAQLVGHKRKSTTSIYTRNFPISVQDEAHLKIIYEILK